MMEDEDQELRWQKAIVEAQSAYKKHRFFQYRIACLAFEVCEITHGGRQAEGAYTIQRFAKESNIHPKTLSNWMAIKHLVYDKLDDATKADLKFSEAMYIGKDLKSSSTSKQVKAAVIRYRSYDDFDRRMKRYCEVVRSLYTNVSKRSALVRCDKQILNSIYFYVNRLNAEFEKSGFKPKSKPPKLRTSNGHDIGILRALGTPQWSHKNQPRASK